MWHMSTIKKERFKKGEERKNRPVIVTLCCQCAHLSRQLIWKNKQKEGKNTKYLRSKYTYDIGSKSDWISP